MKITTRQAAEAFGVISIVASLVFVGLQLRLEGRVALAEQYASRAESAKADVRAKMESEDYLAMEAKFWLAGNRPEWWNDQLEDLSEELNLTPTDISLIYLDRRLMFLLYDNLYFQYDQGLLGEGFRTGARNRLKFRLRDPFTRSIFLTQGQGLSGEIRELVAEIDNEQ